MSGVHNNDKFMGDNMRTNNTIVNRGRRFLIQRIFLIIVSMTVTIPIVTLCNPEVHHQGPPFDPVCPDFCYSLNRNITVFGEARSISHVHGDTKYDDWDYDNYSLYKEQPLHSKNIIFNKFNLYSECSGGGGAGSAQSFGYYNGSYLSIADENRINLTFKTKATINASASGSHWGANTIGAIFNPDFDFTIPFTLTHRGYITIRNTHLDLKIWGSRGDYKDCTPSGISQVRLAFMVQYGTTPVNDLDHTLYLTVDENDNAIFNKEASYVHGVEIIGPLPTGDYLFHATLMQVTNSATADGLGRLYHPWIWYNSTCEFAVEITFQPE